MRNTAVAPSPRRFDRFLLAALLTLVAGALVQITLLGAPSPPFGSGVGGARGLLAPSPGQEPAVQEDPPTERQEEWQEVERLLSEDKVQAALDLVVEIRDRAREANDSRTLARALIFQTQLETALHGYEQAVRGLMEEPWPEQPAQHAAIELFYAQGLVNYIQAYSWEIRQRERTSADTLEELDLKQLTHDQLVTEAHRALNRVWLQRDSWGDADASEQTVDIAEFLVENNYPERIRGTLRDRLTYLWADLLSNSSHWTAQQSNELFRLDPTVLIDADSALRDVDLAGVGVHPLVKMSALLGDLERWHSRQGRPEAAFEARLERLRGLSRGFGASSTRSALLREALESSVRGFDPELPWWSMGMARLAEQAQADADLSEPAVAAHAFASEGLAAHPDSVGAQACRALIAAIERPDVSVNAMSSDGPRRRSIEVTYRNVEALHFRAYAVDLERRLTEGRDYQLLNDARVIEGLLAQQSPLREWSQALPRTTDYRHHRAFVTPPLEEPGLYVVLASVDAGFAPEAWKTGLNFLVTDLVLLTRTVASAQVDSAQAGAGFQQREITVRSGETGRVVAGADVDLYRFDYQRGHSRVATQRTDGNGIARFDGRGFDGRGESRRGRNQYFAVARLGDDAGLDANYYNFSQRQQETEHTAALIYTDRSIYRPDQVLHFKVVAFSGQQREGHYAVREDAPLQVDLLDANGEVVDTVSSRTNTFGSASGEFRIPSGRLLGSWALRASVERGPSHIGYSNFQVEEYKRPTFEVTLEPSQESLRLNRAAEVSGSVRYYFGLPVVSGEVRWRVTREPIYPYWWYWYSRPTTGTQQIASGDASLDEEGRFDVTFVPEAEEPLDDEGRTVRYRYRVVVDVTDEGGETRSAERQFHLGFVAVQASLSSDLGFTRADRAVELRARRSDLDGNPRSGSGRFRLVLLEQPESALLPAEQPTPRRGTGLETPGDRLRTRQAPDYKVAQVLRSWNDGRVLARDSASHGEDGEAAIALGRLRPGAYRLYYETEDEYGATAAAQHEFVVARQGSTKLELPAILRAERPSVDVGGTAHLLAHSGLDSQEMLLEVFRHGERIEVRRLESADGLALIDIPVTAELRGGFAVALTLLRDHQLVRLTSSVFVPWQDRELQTSFETFRDLLRPGQQETWRVKVQGAEQGTLEQGSVELLAYMYDRSLDLFGAHTPPSVLLLYPHSASPGWLQSSLGVSRPVWSQGGHSSWVVGPGLHGDSLRFLSGYGIGGPGGRGFRQNMRLKSVAANAQMETITITSEAPLLDEYSLSAGSVGEMDSIDAAAEEAPAAGPPPAEGPDIRTEFSETAFWHPHLVLDSDGGVSFEFTVPDSVTEWNVWLHALTRDLRGGSSVHRTRTVKDLLVRPYLPRFLREADRADITVVVNNAGETLLEGELDFDIIDPETEESLLAEFGLDSERARRPFRVEAGGGTELGFAITVPARVGTVAFRVVASAGDLSDGELRPVPVLPGRIHLTQSRFVTLSDQDRRELRFDELLDSTDDTRINDRMVVTLDAQLFYSVLSALPYLIDYPYECTEQTLNRFLSTGILSSLFDRYPSVGRMAERLATRDTQYERFDQDNPDRRMLLEESPWLQQSRGGTAEESDLIKVLDPRVASAQRQSSLAELTRSQTAIGGFPWWTGGPPSPYMTLYVLEGLARAIEFEVELPNERVLPMAQSGWRYLQRHYVDEIVARMVEGDCCWETVTYMNYVLSSYGLAPSGTDAWTGGVFTAEDRESMLDYSFEHWRLHSPRLKAMLALTLERAGRGEDAKLVLDSVMDSARTERDLGTYWAREDRSWLWYNDSIESHAFVLRALSELEPGDDRRPGLVQWLLLNKKLNHWKSTRATSEVIYSLAHYLEQEGTLEQSEAATVTIGDLVTDFEWSPDEYTGKQQQIVVAGEKVGASTATVVVEKETPGLLFASATWHFSTEKLPAASSSDFFAVDRRFFLRAPTDDGFELEPLTEGTRLVPGDTIEVQLSLRSDHQAEYVHLRDPRGAGFEPVSLRSGHQWNLGISWYEEVRDSGTNFFFERLPAGEYTFKYRLRATTAGTFKVSPARVQSMYAPEFTAYSSGTTLSISP